MADRDPRPEDHLEQARETIHDAVQLLEEAQRVLFRAGDGYVAEVWGCGVRNVLEITERLSDVCGDLSRVDIDVGRLSREGSARSRRTE